MQDEGNLFRMILRIISPEEISDLTSQSSGSQRVPLTDLAEGIYLKGKTEEEIFEDIEKGSDKNRSIEVKTEEPDEAQEDGWELEEGEDGEGSDSEEGEEEVVVPDNLLDMASFILEEKEKSSKSQKKLKGSEVMGLYKKTSMVDIEQEKKIKDDLSKSSNLGILINKRQY
jgi:hypothetical protein